MQTLTLDLPPSLNRYYRHVGSMVMISAAGREYREHVRKAVIEQQVMPYGAEVRLWMHVLVERADLRRADLDNSLKALQDSMEADAKSNWPGVYENDGQIDLLVVERGAKQKRPQVTVSIGALDGQKLSVLQSIRSAVYAGAGRLAANDSEQTLELVA